ncbi:PDZ domain-containing protein [Serratia fonticola]|uniref:PDZ domain-containing protein n=1 Tax=Serratia fonticola TaxID=47917 RepID=UPI00192AC608|nr:PDZ domain-containing protein [Serratia fonticola]MBL5904459.1 PDZ domain-containing protein [Serratia fonticola]
MKKATLIIFSILWLSGCVSKSERSAQQAEIEKTIPICQSDKQCEAAWSGARQWINENCGMKIQTYSNDYIETYNSIGSSAATSCQVNKTLLPNGITAISIKIQCANIIGCVPDQYESVMKFNKDLNYYISQFAPIKLGFVIGMATKNGIEAKSASDSFGLLIRSVEPGGIAQSNGLQPNDIITYVNESRVVKLIDYGNLIDKHARGDKLMFSVLRNGTEVKIPVII